MHFLTVKVLSDALFKTTKNTIVCADSAQQLDFERLIKYVIKPFTCRMFFSGNQTDTLSVFVLHPLKEKLYHDNQNRQNFQG